MEDLAAMRDQCSQVGNRGISPGKSFEANGMFPLKKIYPSRGTVRGVSFRFTRNKKLPFFTCTGLSMGNPRNLTLDCKFLANDWPLSKNCP